MESGPIHIGGGGTGNAQTNTKNDPPSYTIGSNWSVPKRSFGDASFFRSSIGNDNSLNTNLILREAREWKVASIAVNPNSQSLLSANPNLTYEQRKEFIKSIYPDSVIYGDVNPIPYQEILLNPFLVTTFADANSIEWQDTMKFWCYPNGEFLPVSTSAGFPTYQNFWPFPPQMGNPQNSNISVSQSYEFIKKDGESFQVTSVPTVVAFGVYTNNANNFISKTFYELDKWIKCGEEEFGVLNFAGPGNRNCYKLKSVNSISTINDDILTLYPKPPENRQSATKPIVRYSSVQKNESDNTDKNWIYLRYYRNSYNASDMQCAITKNTVLEINNKPFITFKNGFSFTNNQLLELERDPTLFQTGIQETAEQIERKIEVTCNPVFYGKNRVPTNETYVSTMLKYCGKGNVSVYKDSIFLSGADTNLNRNDPEGNPLGYGTLQRWDSDICKNFTLTSLVRSSDNFMSWCSDIENWTENGGCFNMANAITPDNQNAVNNTLRKLCEGEVLDSKPCLQYCFAKNTDNLDCSVNLGSYCKRLVTESIQDSYPDATFTNSNNSITTQLPVIVPSPDGFDVSLSARTVNTISQKVIKDHPQCSCFMPRESFEAYYKQITEDFPPSPELNAFILHYYNQPSCSYPACVYGSYTPRGIALPVLKNVANITNLRCPTDFYVSTVIVEKGPDVPEKIWLRECKFNGKGDVPQQTPIPFCPETFVLSNKCKTDKNGIACTEANQQCTKTTQIIGGQCPNVIFCVQNAVFDVRTTGVKASVNIEGEIDISQECNLSLSKFNKYIDTKLVATINPSTSLYEKCYSVDNDHVLTLSTLRAVSTGGPAIPLPLFVCKGYFAFNASNQMQLIVKNLVSGTLPSPIDNVSNPSDPLPVYKNNNLVCKYIRYETRITAIGPTNGGLQGNLHTFLVSNQNVPLGSENEPLDIFLENVAPTFDEAPPEFIPQGSQNFVPFEPMDFVHVYESNAWINMINTVPTKFTGKLLKSSSTGVQNLVEITLGSISGPLGPGLLSAKNGVKKNTYLKELVTSSPLVWSYESEEVYSENVGFVEMFVNVTSVERYFTGYVKEVTSNSMDIVCLETNEDINQNQWSFSNVDLRSIDANSQLATHWIITRDGESKYFPSGDEVDENSWQEIVDPKPVNPNPNTQTGIEEQDFFPEEKIKTSSSTILIIIVGIILLVVAVIIAIIIATRKKK